MGLRRTIDLYRDVRRLTEANLQPSLGGKNVAMTETQRMLVQEVNRAFHDGENYRLSCLAMMQYANRVDVWDWVEEIAAEVEAEVFLSRLGTTFVMVPR